MSERPGPPCTSGQAALRERLDGRDLHPGSLFPSEAALRQEFDVSRSVVRQALATLEAGGLVRKVHGKGSVVAEHPEVHRDVLRSGLTLRARSVTGLSRPAWRPTTIVLRPDHLTSLTG